MEPQDQFTTLYHEYADRIYRFLVWRTGDATLAEDLVAETFLRAWRSRHRFDGAHAQAWLFRIARNLLVDNWRKHRDLPLDEAIDRTGESDVERHTHERIDQTADFQRLHRAIRELREPYQSVVILRFLEEYNVQTVSATLRLSPANVRVIQYRALQQLKHLLGQ